MLLSDELKSSTIGNIRSGYCDTRPLEEDRERERGKERGREREGEREKESGEGGREEREGGREEREGERKEGGRDEVREVERRIIQINCLLTYKCEKFLQFSTVSNFYQIRSQLKILRKENNILTNEHQKNEDVCVCVCVCAHIQSGTKNTFAQGYTRITQSCFRPSFLTIYIQVRSNEINPSSVIIKGKKEPCSFPLPGTS